eukprot:3528057-Pyramimonas_sp.AAC.2
MRYLGGGLLSHPSWGLLEPPDPQPKTSAMVGRCKRAPAERAQWEATRRKEAHFDNFAVSAITALSRSLHSQAAVPKPDDRLPLQAVSLMGRHSSLSSWVSMSLSAQPLGVSRTAADTCRAMRSMHIHRSCRGPPWAQDLCTCLPGQARRANAPILGPGWTWPGSV